MRAYVVDAIGGTPRLRDVPEPESAEHESVVRMHAAALGHIDMQVIRGQFPIMPSMPLIGGSEGSGVIVSSDTFEPGTPVRVRGGGLGVKRAGTWSELVAVPDDAVHVLQQAGHWGLATAFFSPATTAWAALHRVANVKRGESVAVLGASGAVGSMAVQLASDAGCHVTAVVGSSAKAEMVPDVADQILVMDADGQTLGGATPQSGFDIIIDPVGGAPLAATIAAAGRGVRVVMVGYTAGEHIETAISRLLVNEVSLLPMNLLTWGPLLGDEADELLGRLIDGHLSLAVTSFAFEHFEEAIAAVDDRAHVGRIVLDVS